MIAPTVADIVRRTTRPLPGPSTRQTRAAAELPRAAAGRGAMRRGVRWTAPSQVLVQVLRILTTLVLARLLAPSDFGLVALVTVVTGFFERVLGDTGTTSALVQRERLTQGLASSVLFWNLLVGATTTTAFVVLAAPIAQLLGDDAATGIVRVLGCMAVVNAAMYVPTALMRRNLQFRRLAVINTVNVFTTMAASIGLAVAGLGAWGLAVGNVTGSVVAVVVTWVWSDWRPMLRFARADLSEIAGFSARLSFQNLFGYFAFAGDRLLVGRFLGVADLGYYGMANRLLRYPLATTAQTYRDVVFPNLARLQGDDERMLDTYRRTLGAITLVLMPLCFTIAAVADPLVRAVLGAKWVPAIPVVALIAVVGGLQALATTTGSLYLAKGRADLSLRWSMGSSAFLMVCYGIGTLWGVTGVAAGFLAGIVLLLYPAFRIPLALIGARPSDLAGSVLPPALCAVAGAGAAYGTVEAFGAAGQSDAVRLTAGVLVSLAVTLNLLLLVRPGALHDLLGLTLTHRRARVAAGGQDGHEGQDRHDTGGRR